MTLAKRPDRAGRARRATATLLGVALAGSAGVVASTAQAAPGEPEEVDCSTVPWMDTSLSAAERTDALLDASSQHQKYRWLVEQPANDPTRTEWAPGFDGEDPVVYPEQLDCTPRVIYNNGPDGVYLSPGTTAWPGPIAVAATWNLELGEQKAVAHGSESFDKQNAVILGPGIASGRTPLSGRTSEYFGEDPLLSGLMAASNVRGLEDGNPDKPIVANLKHYVANEQEEARDASSSNIDERTFKQVYDLPYEIAVRESDPGSLMCSYNQVNGVYACENPILTTSLREDYPFEGYVMSDFGSVHSTAPSLNAGLDQELNRPVWFTPARLDAALEAGEITQERIDEAASRVVHSYIDGGLFDNPIPDEPVADVSTPENKALARELAEQGTVLLKNDGALPLAEGDLTVAVIGQTASSEETDGVSAETGCAWDFPFGPGGTVLNCDALVDPLTALTERVTDAGGEVVYDNGADPVAAAQVAAAADVALVFGHYTMGESQDLPDLNLDGNGDELMSAVAAAAPRTVAVINAGSAVEMPWIEDVDAVLHAWHSGEQFGPALAALVYGDANPSGKLPMTFPVSLDDTPTAGSQAQYPGIPDEDGILQVDYSEGLQVGYKWYDEQGIEPLFPFGHGLSYTDFDYSDLQVEAQVDSATGAVRTTVGFTVQNTGETAGAEVPQVYLTLPESADEPGKRLVGFDRVELDPGAQADVEMVVDSEASNHPLSVWDTNADAWTIVDGSYTVSVGSSSRDLALAEEFAVELGEVPAPKVERVFGKDRYGTAAAISALYPDGVETVYIASGTGFADALSGSPAASRGLLRGTMSTPEGDPAPVLLVKNDQIPQDTRAALAAVDPSSIVILGGPGAVSSGVAGDLEAYGEVSRVEGTDRYETAANLAMMFEDPEVVYVASGQDRAYADALTGAARAGMENAPVLLTRPDRVPGATADALEALDPDRVVVLGGPVAVDDDTFAALGADERVSGDDRYETAVAVSQVHGTDVPLVHLASGRNFPDALAGSALAGHQGVPVLLTKPGELPAATLAELERLSPERVVILGGPNAVSQDVEDVLNEYYPDWVGGQP